MVAYMSREALAATLRTGKATFFSRSRAQLWEKGAQSGNTLRVQAIHTDCDTDALLLLVDPVGPTCHTGSASCFFRAVRADATTEDASDGGAQPALAELERVVAARK